MRSRNNGVLSKIFGFFQKREVIAPESTEANQFHLDLERVSHEEDSCEKTVEFKKPPLLKRQSTVRGEMDRKGMWARKSSKSMQDMSEMLKDGEHRPAKFNLKAADAAKKKLFTAEEVKELANHAIHTGHAEELDILVATFGDDVLPRKYVESQVLAANKSEFYKELLVAGTQRKLSVLEYMLEPGGSFHVVDKSNTEDLRKSAELSARVRRKHTIVVDSEMYSPSHEILSKESMQHEFGAALLRMSYGNTNPLKSHM